MTNEQLVKIRFLGSADPREENGIINLQDGENGEPRSLTLGGHADDALVTAEELHMLTGRYQIEVVEDDDSESSSSQAPTTTSEQASPPAPEGSGASSAPPSTPASPPEPASPTTPSAV